MKTIGIPPDLERILSHEVLQEFDDHPRTPSDVIHDLMLVLTEAIELSQRADPLWCDQLLRLKIDVTRRWWDDAGSAEQQGDDWWDGQGRAR